MLFGVNMEINKIIHFEIHFGVNLYKLNPYFSTKSTFKTHLKTHFYKRAPMCSILLSNIFSMNKYVTRMHEPFCPVCEKIPVFPITALSKMYQMRSPALEPEPYKY